MPVKVNVGCGRNVMQGWINVDRMKLPGVDIVADIDRCADEPIPLEDDSVDEFLLSHVIEHIRNPLPLMQELHRIAKSNALAVIRVPYGSSDDAYEDPTHVRSYFLDSFHYFSQPLYWRADYGYRGDWQLEKVRLILPAAQNQGLSPKEILIKVSTLRNQVREMVGELRAVKPVREPRRELQSSAKIELSLV